MRSIPVVVLLLAAAAFPSTLAAQAGEEGPPTLRLSFFMCDTNQLDAAMAEVEARDIPIWKELVAEGMVLNYGYFRHSWADEWNVGIYTVASSIDAVIKASEEAGRRFEARYGDGPDTFGQACPHHRDGFYTLGPTADDGGGEGGGGN